MNCNFRAAMQSPHGSRPFSALAAAAAACVLAAGAAPVWAEKADRTKPLTVEADQQSRIDMAKRIVAFSGNVVITQGTMNIRAERVEVRETAGGYHQASATGRPVVFRQKRDGVDEVIEGRAESLEYDSRAETVRLAGGAVVRRLRGADVLDEISGELITYSGGLEVFEVSGGSSAGSRVRAVLNPRPDVAAPAQGGTR
jgi:lipopolysaccharide export system protein LptA